MTQHELLAQERRCVSFGFGRVTPLLPLHTLAFFNCLLLIAPGPHNVHISQSMQAAYVSTLLHSPIACYWSQPDHTMRISLSESLHAASPLLIYPLSVPAQKEGHIPLHVHMLAVSCTHGGSPAHSGLHTSYIVASPEYLQHLSFSVLIDPLCFAHDLCYFAAISCTHGGPPAHRE